MSFHTDAAKAVSAGTGLMDHWFQHAQQTGIRYLEFGTFWTPGEPNSWKGLPLQRPVWPHLHDYPAPRPLGRRQAEVVSLVILTPGVSIDFTKDLAYASSAKELQMEPYRSLRPGDYVDYSYGAGRLRFDIVFNER